MHHHPSWKGPREVCRPSTTTVSGERRNEVWAVCMLGCGSGKKVYSVSIDTCPVVISPGANLRLSNCPGAGPGFSSSLQYPHTQTHKDSNISLQHSHRTTEAGRQPASTFSVLPLQASFLSGTSSSYIPASFYVA